MEILNDLKLSNEGVAFGKKTSEMDLVKASGDLDAAHFKLLMEELQYDEKCLEVYLKKQESHAIRIQQLKDQWAMKRMECAREAIQQWMEHNASQLLVIFNCCVVTMKLLSDISHFTLLLHLCLRLMPFLGQRSSILAQLCT